MRRHVLALALLLAGLLALPFARSWNLLLPGLALAAAAAWRAGSRPGRDRALWSGILLFALFSLGGQLLLGGRGGLAGLGEPAEAAGRLAAGTRAAVKAAIALLSLGAFTRLVPPVEAVESVARLFPGRRSGSRRGGLEIALVLALRLVPLLDEEWTRLDRARRAREPRARGAGPRLARLRDAASAFPAYLGTVLRHAEQVTLALEARGADDPAPAGV